jgi:hypothetical protein
MEAMMLEPTTTWICNTCGELIASAEQGLVEWVIEGHVTSGAKKARDLRLVHHNDHSLLETGCQFDPLVEHAKDRGTVVSHQLQLFLEPDGLTRLLMLLTEGKIPKAELILLILRLHILGYEHGRLYMDKAVEEGRVQLDLPGGFYWQHQLEEALKTREGENG